MRRVSSRLSALCAGLWRDISLRLSACGAYYLACQPEPVLRAAPAEGAPGGLAKAARGQGRAWPRRRAESDDEGAAAYADAEQCESPFAEPEEAEPEDAVAVAAAQTAFRERTLTVPMSVSTSAPTPERLHTLLRLSEVEDGASVSLALVDSDGTVIVSHLYRGMVPPDVLDGPEADEDADA